MLEKELPKEYKKFCNVILNWKMNRQMAFAGLVRAFIKPPATIVDLCAGEKRMYRMFNNGNTLTGRYKFIFGDIREIKGNQYVCDLLDPPEELYGVADGYICDLPWSSTSGSQKEMVKKYHPLSKQEFKIFLPKALKQIEKILKPAGILIVKIAHPWNHIIYQLLVNSFNWKRDIVQISINKGVFLVSYFMVFEKNKGES